MRRAHVCVTTLIFAGLFSAALGGGGGKVMFWMPNGSKSMKITYMNVARELVARGYQVTLVHPFPLVEHERLAGLTEIVSYDALEPLLEEESRIMLGADPSPPPLVDLLAVSLNATDNALKQIRLADSDEPLRFDVVVVVHSLGHEAGYYVARRFGAQFAIYLTTQTSTPFVDWAFGMPHHPMLQPFYFLPYLPGRKMDLVQRTINFLVTYASPHIRQYLVINELEAILDRRFPDEVRPSLLELEKNASLALHFGHPLILDGMRPVLPNYVYVGMMNCREPRPLPQDIADFLDAANEGVVYVSFGSMYTSCLMPESRKRLLLNVFRRLAPLRVLWKWEADLAEKDLPANVKASKWLPQLDVLAHNNTRLFVTHAGQSSCQEALCYKKPVVTVPIFGDQFTNGKFMEDAGLGINAPYTDLTEYGLHDAIVRVLGDPAFSQRAKEFGTLLADQIDRPLDRAVWHIEHLIRNPSLAHHFRSPLHDLAWYEYHQLDLIGLVLSGLILTLVTITQLVATCARACTMVAAMAPKPNKGAR